MRITKLKLPTCSKWLNKMKKEDTVYTRYGEAIVTYVCNVTKTCKVKHINYITPITDFYIKELILK